MTRALPSEVSGNMLPRERMRPRDSFTAANPTGTERPCCENPESSRRSRKSQDRRNERRMGCLCHHRDAGTEPSFLTLRFLERLAIRAAGPRTAASLNENTTIRVETMRRSEASPATSSAHVAPPHRSDRSAKAVPPLIVHVSSSWDEVHRFSVTFVRFWRGRKTRVA